MSWFSKKHDEVEQPQQLQDVIELHTELDNVIRKISDMNFSVEIDPEKFSDDGVELLISLKDMQVNLAEMAGEVTGNTLSLHESSKDLNSTAAAMLDQANDVSESASDVASATTTMSDNMTTISAAAEELNVNIKSISENAEHSSSNVNMVATATEEMTSTVQEIARNTESARCVTGEAVTNVERATQTVLDLEKAANEINNVITTISDISDQTKLLALNATIEAARAGEAGKGFAVVASEVKDLAQQTNVATADISNKILAMQDATKSTINEIEKIKKVILEVSNIVSTIASAVEQQSATTRDIAENIAGAADGINDVTQSVKEGAFAVDEVSQNIASCAGLANDVSDSINSVSSSCIRMKSDSTYLYANAMEVSSRGEDVSKRMQMLQLPESIRKKLVVVTRELFIFTEAWSVLVIEMDTEHKVIFDYINQVHRMIKERKTNSELLPVVRELADFTRRHFDHEEQYMTSAGFPGLSEQKAAHIKLLDNVNSVIAQMDAGEDVNMINVMVFLKDWLQNHILRMDSQYGEYFRDKGELERFNQGKTFGTLTI